MKTYIDGQFNADVSAERIKEMLLSLEWGSKRRVDIQLSDGGFVGFEGFGSLTFGPTLTWEGRLYWDNLSAEQVTSAFELLQK